MYLLTIPKKVGIGLAVTRPKIVAEEANAKMTNDFRLPKKNP